MQRRCERRDVERGTRIGQLRDELRYLPVKQVPDKWNVARDCYRLCGNFCERGIYTDNANLFRGGPSLRQFESIDAESNYFEYMRRN